MPVIELLFPDHRALSWNGLYKTTHWRNRQLIADQLHDLIRAKLIDLGFDPLRKSDILVGKVDITFEAHFKNHPIDSDNILTKGYIDGLKDILLTDDSPLFVRKVSSESIIDTETYLRIVIKTL